MKKLTYVSVDNFLDVDFPIIKELNKTYKLQWILYYQTLMVRTFSIDEVKQFVKENNINIQYVCINTRLSNPNVLLEALRTMKKIKREKPDIIYFQTFFDPYLPVFVRLLLPARKIIVGVHDVVQHVKFSSLAGVIYHNFILSIFRNYHLYSENQAAIFRKKHPSKKIMIAKLYLKNFGKPKTSIDNKSLPVHFLFFGSIRHNKGLEYLIEAGNMLAKDHNNFVITIAGNSSEPEYYQKMILFPERFITRFEIIPNDEIADYFSNSDFLILPYRDVTQSGPLLISYNYNVPVIASDFPGFREYVIHEKNGLLFEPNNPTELYKAMLSIVTGSRDKIERYKINLHEFVEKEINLETIMSIYYQFFDQIK